VGISRSALKTADCRGYADIDFDNVQVTEAALLGEEGKGFSVLDAVLDCGRAGLAAEMLGTGTEAFEMTLEYLKTREQFGQVIGSFQSLGHRAATHFMEMELARSCVEGALTSIDDKAEDAAQLCSLAKCQVGEFLFDMSNDMIQMHGGIGMTDEFDAGLFLKRARTTEAIYGNRSFHLNRYIGHYGI
jgi:alkylation response protein AidB-like acyl-CoA dehydrogenase